MYSQQCNRYLGEYNETMGYVWRLIRENDLHNGQKSTRF